jgi:hypothetical protein
MMSKTIRKICLRLYYNNGQLDILLVNKFTLNIPITFAIASVVVLTNYPMPSTSALNVSAGDPFEVVAKDLTGYHTGKTIKMDCTVDEKPNPPDNELHLTCIEVPKGNHSQTGVTKK